MNEQLKRLLVSLAKLRTKDQQWIIDQLSPEQQQQFVQRQGPELLQQAAKFKRLNTFQTPATHKAKIDLPGFCAKLAQHEPLFIAIILEQGCFSWQASFVSQYYCSQLPTEQLQHIKQATKSHLFEHWQQQLSFQEQLEYKHG